MRPWVSLVATVAMTWAGIVGSPAGAAALPSSATNSVMSIRLVFQPLLPPGSSTWAPHDVLGLGAAASSWLREASGGRAVITDMAVASPVAVTSASCRDLARQVALLTQHRDDADADVVYLGQALDCPYRGLAETPGSWILIPSVSEQPSASARTLAHELGHTLGLSHAGAYTCSILADSELPANRSCAVDAYGDLTDPLGRGTLAWGLNPLNVRALGWDQGFLEVTGEGSHSITLRPAAGPGKDAALVTDPVNGDHYAIAYRAPSPGAALDRDLTATEEGVYLYRMPRAEEPDVGSVLLPWILTPGTPVGGKTGYAYLSPSGGLAVRVTAASGMRATVSVHLDPGGHLTDVDGPVFGEGQPTMTRARRGITLRIPRAFDPSGVTRYEVTVNGRMVHRYAAVANLAARQVPLPSGQSNHVVVRVVDGRGNATAAPLA